MIYLLLRSYAPNTAATNRFMGLLKSISARRIDATVCFFLSDEDNSVAPPLPHITYIYYWKRCNPSSFKLKALLYLIYARQFIRDLQSGDIVYTYGCNEILKLLVNIPGIRTYHERTEHPLVSKLKILNVKSYLNACKKVDGLFVISQSLKEYFHSIGVNGTKIHIINMTVDPARFLQLEKTSKKRYIAYCGNASNNKDGVDQLIKSFSITVQTHPDVMLYIIGPPPQVNDPNSNRKLVEKLGLSNYVKFIGVISSSDIPQVLKDAEVLVLDRPDNIQAKYGFPTKLGEYLLTGNPVVVTAVGDIPLFLTHRENALLAKPSNPSDFSNQINWVLDNPVESSIIGQRGRNVALSMFNSEYESAKIIKIITRGYEFS